MLNFIDIILLAVIGLGAFIGYKVGLVKAAVSLLSFFVAVAVAFIFYKPLAIILTEKTTIDDYIIEHIASSDAEEQSTVSQDDKAVDSKDDSTTSESKMPFTSLSSVLEELPGVITENLDFKEAKTKAKTELANKVSELIMKLLSLIIIYVVVKVTLFVAMILLNALMELPVLKQINEILGLLLGAIVGFANMYIVFAIITFISSITDISFVVDAIKGSLIASLLFENNLLIKLLS